VVETLNSESAAFLFHCKGVAEHTDCKHNACAAAAAFIALSKPYQEKTLRIQGLAQASGKDSQNPVDHVTSPKTCPKLTFKHVDVIVNVVQTASSSTK
jgi:hypothetical protein